MPSGPRVRANNVYGITNDNPLSAASSTFNSDSLPLLPPVVSAHAVIVFDPKRTFGDPEIVVVTVHTVGSTVATMLRGQYGTSQRLHPKGTSWAHVPIDEDYIEIVTSGNRPLDPYRGQMVFETDTNKFVARSVTDIWQDAIPLGAWQAYTPSNTNITVGNGNQIATFARAGRIIFLRYSLVWGNTTSYTGTVSIGLPVAAVGVGTNIQPQSLTVTLLDISARFFIGVAYTNETDATHAGIMQTTGSTNATGRVDATSPFLWTTGDILSVTGSYESAV